MAGPPGHRQFQGAAVTVLFSGGSGLLGRTMQKIAPNWLYPSHKELDVTDTTSVGNWFIAHPGVKTIVHAAAFISPPRVQKEPMLALRVNVVGTANMAAFAKLMGARLVYISTDYVFDGQRGMYLEKDAVRPTSLYAWSKLGGECAVRMYDRGLIVRTSFGPDEFPYPGAYADQWTSRLPVSEFARRLKRIVEDDELVWIIHVGGPRRTVFEYAQEISPGKDIQKLSRWRATPVPPFDTSLDTQLYDLRFNTRPTK